MNSLMALKKKRSTINENQFLFSCIDDKVNSSCYCIENNTENRYARAINPRV
jgi:hypothetical protein